MSRLKPNLLFISPTIPAASGYGGAMRAGIFIQSFAQIYDISLLVINVWDRPQRADALMTHLCKTTRVVSVDELAIMRKDRSTISIDEPIDRLHIFRLSIVPFVATYLALQRDARPFTTLDLDDFESKAAMRTARLHEAAGDRAEAAILTRRAARYAAMESRYLRLFDQVYVCQRGDCDEIGTHYPGTSVYVVPNVVRLPEPVPRIQETTPTLLFVGTLDYAPNIDGITWFCNDVLPLISAESDIAFRVLVVGSRPPASVLALQSIVSVTVIGDAATVTEFYGDSAISIVPIRVGGGTRIKILEGMSHSRPVVATSVGAEGMDVRHNEQILIADTPREFANQCLHLLRDSAASKRIGIAGFRWLSSHHLFLHADASIRSLDCLNGITASASCPVYLEM